MVGRLQPPDGSPESSAWVAVRARDGYRKHAEPAFCFQVDGNPPRPWHRLRPFMGHKDIAIIHSVADILGLNTITRTVIAKGVGAMIGMAEITGTLVQESKPAIAITSAGVTTPCVMRIRELLEAKGYEIIAFHCNGIGARAMEELAAEGKIRGIIDLSPHDIADNLYGGIFPSDDHRLELPCAHAVPIVFVPGGLDFILSARSTQCRRPCSSAAMSSTILAHAVRANFQEMERIGLEVTAKLLAMRPP